MLVNNEINIVNKKSISAFKLIEDISCIIENLSFRTTMSYNFECFFLLNISLGNK